MQLIHLEKLSPEEVLIEVMWSVSSNSFLNSPPNTPIDGALRLNRHIVARRMPHYKTSFLCKESCILVLSLRSCDYDYYHRGNFFQTMSALTLQAIITDLDHKRQNSQKKKSQDAKKENNINAIIMREKKVYSFFLRVRKYHFQLCLLSGTSIEQIYKVRLARLRLRLWRLRL
jgi:hypothetical protein